MTTTTQEETQVIGGIVHTKDNTFNYRNHGKIEKLHPLGDVYRNGKFGFVASGYDWWRFEIKDLDTIINNY